jgi:hypothetical protein
MRLVRSVQVAIGLTAAGGMAVVLSGSALAADGGLVTTPQKLLNTSAQTVSTTGSASVVIVSNDDSSTQGGGSGQSQGSGPEAGKAGTTTAPVEASSQADKKPVPAAGGVAEGSEPVKVSGAADEVSGAGGGLVLKSDGTKTGQEAQAIQKEGAGDSAGVVATAATTAAEAGAVAPQTVRTTILKLQPTITNRVKVLSEDLAATVPSAAAPVKAPTPAKSTGLLGHLKAELAGTTIPQPVLPFGLAAGTLMFAVNLLTLIVLLANVFTFTYGLWLRRGGFATAARSDAPSNSLLPVATPYLLGYASLPLRTHSPLFNGGRNETKIVSYVSNAFRKEERL